MFVVFVVEIKPELYDCCDMDWDLEGYMFLMITLHQGASTCALTSWITHNAHNQETHNGTGISGPLRRSILYHLIHPMVM